MMVMTLEDARKLNKLMDVQNKWRQRNVELYEHPTDPDKVISVGLPWGGGAPIIVEETRAQWEQCLVHGKRVLE